MRNKGKYVVWPQYFDASLTWREGRRVSKNLSTRLPRAEEVGKAASDAGYNPELVKLASYPPTPWVKTGYVLVQAKEKKGKILKEIAKHLPRA